MRFDAPETYAPVIAGVAAVFMIVRFTRINKIRRLRLGWLWATPAILMLATGALLWQLPPKGLEWLWLAVAFALGGVIGWQRGRMMTITIDPDTHELNQKASMLTVMILLGLVAVRYLMKAGLEAEADLLHLSAAFITDVFVVFAVGIVVITRLEMFIRARRMLVDARAAGQVVGEARLP